MSHIIKPPSIKELRSFGLLMGVFIAGIFGFLIPWLWGLSYMTWPWIASGVFIFFSLIGPKLLKPVFYGWMKFGGVVGAFNTRVILFVVYYFLIFPIAVLLRIFGWDAMHRSLKEQTDSYRIKSSEICRDDMENPF